MRIGVSLASSHPDIEDGREGAARMVRRTQAAWSAGLSSLTIGDHHVNGSPYFQNTPMLGRLLAEWGDRPAGCLFLLPLWNPVLLAEQVGTLASMAEGQFIVQTGIGYPGPEAAGMNEHVPHRGRFADLVIPLIDRLLAGETVSEPELGIVDARISPIPHRPVRWWVGAMSPDGIDRAARVGAAWYCSPRTSFDTMAELIDRYRQACASYDVEPEIAIRQDCYVAATDAEAAATIEDLVAKGYRGMTSETLAFGSVERVAERFASIRDLGADEVVVRQVSLPPDEAVASIERMGDVQKLLRPTAGSSGPRLGPTR